MQMKLIFCATRYHQSLTLCRTFQTKQRVAKKVALCGDNFLSLSLPFELSSSCCVGF